MSLCVCCGGESPQRGIACDRCNGTGAEPAPRSPEQEQARVQGNRQGSAGPSQWNRPETAPPEQEDGGEARCQACGGTKDEPHLVSGTNNPQDGSLMGASFCRDWFHTGPPDYLQPLIDAVETAPPGEQVDDAVSSAIAQLVTAGWVCKSCKAINHISSDEAPPLVVQLRQTRAALVQAQAERDEYRDALAKIADNRDVHMLVKQEYHERAEAAEAELAALQSTLDSQVARCAELETALREIAGVWPGEIGAEPKEDWRKTRARAALSPIPSEREEDAVSKCPECESDDPTVCCEPQAAHAAFPQVDAPHPWCAGCCPDAFHETTPSPSERDS